MSTDLTTLRHQLNNVERDLRLLTEEMRRRTDAIGEGIYALLARRPIGTLSDGPRHLEFWSRWNAACSRRDGEYPAPSSERGVD